MEYLNRRKGVSLSIKSVAMITLGILVVVVVYAATTGWFNTLGEGFVGNINYPTASN